MEKLSDKLFFYRLEGMRFMAILSPRCQQKPELIIHEISDIICNEYRKAQVSVFRPCSFALMEYDPANLSPADFMEQMVTLIKIAKRDTDHLFVEYSPENNQQIQQVTNTLLALNHDVVNHMANFRIVIQPIVSAKGSTANRIIGGEVLLRWQRDGKDVVPQHFIPLLEQENMILVVGKWVFEQVAIAYARLVKSFPDIHLSFNVSQKQILDDSFADFMEETLLKYHVDGSGLIAEMTESCMDEQPEKLTRFVNACHKMNIRIALDDYGSGYSGLRMLLQYPSDIVKLDRSLLKEIMESDDKQNFISIIVYACHRFGRTICMEGVETAEQDTLVKDCGCDLIQGFYYHKPMEIDDFHNLVLRAE